MAYPGVLDLQALAKLNGLDLGADGTAALGARALDADGDGRPDLYLVDTDGDGAADGVVRAVDTDGDGVNDTFIQYDEEGTVESIGRVDPATGELEVVYEEPDAIDAMLGSLGLADLESPEEALYTSFGDPYIAETYGSFGEEVPETYAAAGDGVEPPVVEDLKVIEVDEGAAAAPGPDEEAAGAAEPPEVVPRIVEIEDRSGGQGSSLWAKVDEDGDGLADSDARLEKTSTGTYYGDIDKNGYSEDVATDLDGDNRIDTVDATGRGSSADTVGADQIVDPADGHLVDHGTADDDAPVSGSVDASDDISSGSDYDSGGSTDTSVSVDTGSDTGSGGSSSGGDDTV